MTYRLPLLMVFAALSLSACQQTFDGMKKDFGALRTSIDNRVASLSKGDAQNSESAPQTLIGARTLAPGACPPVMIEENHRKITEFQDMSTPTANTEISTLNLVSAQTECQINAAENKLEMRIDLTFNGALGPKARRLSGDQPFFAYPYFIAVTDGQGQSLAEEVFAATITYEKDQNTIEVTETIRQRLPLTPDGLTPAYEIHVGFQLTEDQLAFNAAK